MRLRPWLLAALLVVVPQTVTPQVAPSADPAEPVEITRGESGRFTIVARDAELAEVYEMLARVDDVSVVVGDDVDGEVSVSLFDVELDRAVRAIAEAAGYAVERRGDAYVVIERDDLGLDDAGGSTQVRAFKIQYSDVENVREILEKHLSRYGEITALEGRRMLVVEDLPGFLDRVGKILEEIDREPRQILLEAKVLEIVLSSNDIFGIDWQAVSKWDGNKITVGVRGLANPTAPGLFFDLITDNFEGFLEALSEQGRVRALATPRLLTLEGEEAEVLVGDRLGFNVTTTINQVTTESVEFIDSGVILRFTASVDRKGRVLLDIHPEVSTGTIEDGIPQLRTTEATTQLLAEDGQKIFIGGLIRDRTTEARRSVPLLGRIPWLGLLFSRNEWSKLTTETVVIVQPTVVGGEAARRLAERSRRAERIEPTLEYERRKMVDDLDVPWRKPAVDDEPVDEPGPASVDPAVLDGEAPLVSPGSQGRQRWRRR